MPMAPRMEPAKQNSTPLMTMPTARLNSSPRRMARCATPGRRAPMYWVMTAIMPEEMMENMMTKMLM